MRKLDKLVRIVGAKDVNVSLYGESGCGKEVLARRVHGLSSRREGPFVPINCAAVPEHLFESELFGHERGAFTGAVERALGKIEAAERGTLFLDEIGEMPLAVQAKLLRFLESRRFMRVGGNRKLEVDARVICATLRPLKDDVRIGRFRADLFYRIQGVPLVVPPLRDRREDLPVLIEQLRLQLAAQHRVAAIRLTRGALDILSRYSWPGNVRELRNVLELLTLLFEGRAIRPVDLPEDLRGDAQSTPPGFVTISLDHPLAQAVDQIVEGALALENGNITRAAARLGVSVRTLQRRRVGVQKKRAAARSTASASRPDSRHATEPRRVP